MPHYDARQSLGLFKTTLPHGTGDRHLGHAWPMSDLFAHPIDWSNKSLHALSLQNEKDLLAWILCVLAQSPSARLMIKEALNEGWQIALNDLGDKDFHLDVQQRLIVLHNNSLQISALIRSEHFQNALLVSLGRALRDVWQERRYGGFDEHYGPESILMLERVRTADCDTLSILVSWELRSEGFNDLWRHLIGSEQGDMAIAFSNRLEKDPGALFTGQALQATFKQWYQSERRINACDHETLEYLDDLIKTYADENPFGENYLNAIAIERLSCLPDKTAYLRGCGTHILSNPLYSGLNDAINQSHFMQIMYDLEVTLIEGIPFRDATLAAKFFPKKTLHKEYSGSC